MKSLGNGKLTATFDAECVATRELLDRVGDKWSVSVVVSLAEGAVRFNGLKRAIPGISGRMLTATLRGLERDGLVERRVYPTNPPQVDYRLSGLGESLLEPVTTLAVWAQNHRLAVQEAREAFEVERERRSNEQQGVKLRKAEGERDTTSGTAGRPH